MVEAILICIETMSSRIKNLRVRVTCKLNTQKTYDHANEELLLSYGSNRIRLEVNWEPHPISLEFDIL